jgi:hypothetical protein
MSSAAITLFFYYCTDRGTKALCFDFEPCTRRTLYLKVIFFYYTNPDYERGIST